MSVACSSDDDGGSEADLVGKWKADLFHIEGDFDGGHFQADGIDFGNVIVNFKEDGTYSSEGGDFTVEFTINFMGMEISEQMTNDNPLNQGTWEKIGNTLRITNENDPEVYDYKIDKLTSKRLELSLDDYEVDADGVEGEFKAKLGFKK